MLYVLFYPHAVFCLTCVTLGSMGHHSPVSIKTERMFPKEKKSLKLDENHLSKGKKTAISYSLLTKIRFYEYSVNSNCPKMLYSVP